MKEGGHWRPVVLGIRSFWQYVLLRLAQWTPTKLRPDDLDCPLKLDHDVCVRLEKLLVEGVGEGHCY